ncbi:hypothetical protein [Mitsuaria sp. 7]|uniref:hypothetical protein n=1 Tax=Mitsuaria sp. 7 TaxID=1658665 RepID=UPI0012F84A6C|nr:hypothetical protein [Mitsuaria sp. 7]
MDEAWLKGWPPFRSLLAPAIGRLFGVDAGAVQVCGSARFGFSMMRSRRFEAHRSDLDVAVIDRALFDEIVADIDGETGDLAPYLRIGMVRLDRVPGSPRVARWRSGLSGLLASGCWPFSEITVSVYAGEADFLAKQAYALLMFRGRMSIAGRSSSRDGDPDGRSRSTDVDGLEAVSRLMAALNFVIDRTMTRGTAGADLPPTLRGLVGSLPYVLQPLAMAWPTQADDSHAGEERPGAIRQEGPGLLFLTLGEPTVRDEVFQSLRAMRRLIDHHAPHCRTILLGLSEAQMAEQLSAVGAWAATIGRQPMTVVVAQAPACAPL